MRLHIIKTGLLAGLLAMIATISWAQEPQAMGQNDQKIHDIARIGTGAEIASILKANPAMRDARTGLGSTPLHLAATNSDSGPLKALLAAGADVNAKDSDASTPLHLAAYTNRIENAKILLEAGADVNAVSTGGRTPVALARKARADEVAGIISLWMLKGCKPGGKCEQASTYDLKRLAN